MTSSVHYVETNDEVFPVVQTMGGFGFVIMRVIVVYPMLV